MRNQTVFDIHLASDTMSVALEQKLNKLGFSRDRFVGGIEGVIRQNHFSKHLETRDLFVKSWSDLISLLATAPEYEFHGYAEAEVISAQHRMPIKCQPFNASIPFPFGPFEQE